MRNVHNQNAEALHYFEPSTLFPYLELYSRIVKVNIHKIMTNLKAGKQ